LSRPTSCRSAAIRRAGAVGRLQRPASISDEIANSGLRTSCSHAGDDQASAADRLGSAQRFLQLDDRRPRRARPRRRSVMIRRSGARHQRFPRAARPSGRAPRHRDGIPLDRLAASDKAVFHGGISASLALDWPQPGELGPGSSAAATRFMRSNHALR
jgi:hypothetical protein